MLRKLYIGFIFSLFIWNYGQAKNPNKTIIDFYRNEMRLLDKELYLLGLNTNIPVYLNDSFNTILTTQERKDRGADYIKPNTIDSLKDYTLWPKKYLDPDSVADDIPVIWNIILNADGSMTYSPKAIAVARKAMLNNMTFLIPLFYFRWADIKDKLPKDRHEFLEHYIRWKIIARTESYPTEESSFIDRYWTNWIDDHFQSSYSVITSRMIGDHTAYSCEYYLFSKYTAKEIKLLSNNKSITWEEYILKHQMVETSPKSQIFNTKDTIGDTTFYYTLFYFDSIDIIFKDHKYVWKVWQKVSNLDESFPSMIQYTIDDADARRVLHPDLYFYCTYFARHRRD